MYTLGGRKIVNLNKKNRDRDMIVKKLRKQEVADRDDNSQYCLMYKLQVKPCKILIRVP